MKKIIISVVIALSLAVVFGGLYSTLAQQKVEKGANWETECNEEQCQTTIYSYEKYWKNSQGEWEEIDENFYDCSSGGEKKYCTKTYHFYVEADALGNVKSVQNAKNFNMKLSNFKNTQPSFSPRVNGSVLIYENVIPNVDLRYQYLPRKVKEEIVIKEKLPNLGTEDFNISFEKSGNTQVKFAEFYICDNGGFCEYMQSFVGEDEIIVQIPVQFLNEAEYPVVIDPSIELNHSDISWNGFVLFDSGDVPSYTRFNNPTSITLSPVARGDIDWNLSSIPDGSEIVNASLDLKLGAPSFPYNLSIWHMEGNNNSYPDTTGDCPSGNCLFYNDMANGTEYNRSIIGFKNGHIIIEMPPSAVSDIENSLSDDLWSIGLSTTHTSSVSVGAKDNSIPENRPKITIVYGANQTNSDSAIEKGINNSLPGNPVKSAQQVYLVNENGNHYLGTFNKATILYNQTWVFYYTNNPATLLNIPSLFSVLNVWENQTLSYEEIVSQVESFINNTKY